MTCKKQTDSSTRTLEESCNSMITAPPGRRVKVYFQNCGGAEVNRIENTLLIYTRNGNEGTLLHLTRRSAFGSCFKWLWENAPKESQVYLIGGGEFNEEGYIVPIKGSLRARGYIVTDEEIATVRGRGIDFVATRSGLANVHCYKRLPDLGSRVLETVYSRTLRQVPLV